MSTSTIHEYAFDVKMYAVVRVKASSEADAREAMEQALDCMDLSEYTIGGINETLAAGMQITEASLHQEDGGPFLFELDGKNLDEGENGVEQ